MPKFTTRSLENILVELDLLFERGKITTGEYAIIGLLLKLYEEALESRAWRNKISGPTQDMVNELNKSVHKISKKIDRELSD